LEEAAAAAEKALSTAKEEHSAQVKSIEDAAAAGGETALAAARAEHSSQVKALEETVAAGEGALAAAKEEHAAQVKSLEEAVAAASEAAASAEKELASHKEASQSVESSAEKAAEAARESAAEREASLKAEASAELEAALAAAEEKHAAELKEAVAAAQSKADEELSAAAASMAESTAKDAAAAAAELSAAREAHAKELAAAHAETETAIAATTAAEAAVAAATEEKAAAQAAADAKLTEAGEAAAAAAEAATAKAQQLQDEAVAAAEAAKDEAAAAAAKAAADAAEAAKADAVATAVSAAEEMAAAAAKEQEAATAEAAEKAAADAAKELADLKDDLEGKLSASEGKLKAVEETMAEIDAIWTSKMTTALADAAKAAEESEKAAVAAEAAAKQKLLDDLEKKRLEAYTDYLAENKKRKAVHNKLIELQGNIRVFARCRPMVEAELRSGKCDDVTEFPAPEDIVVYRDAITTFKFEFDQVFKPDSEQAEVFAHVKPFATSFLDGYNVCIFAYGQTGSGKTYTMEGPPENRGVNLRCLEELFRLANEERASEMSYEFVLSYLEIYNESVHDLLTEKPASGAGAGGGKKALEVRQSAGGNVVPGLSAVPVSSIEEVLALMERGASNRAVGSHDMNEHSSRSHSILTLNCVGTPLAEVQAASASSGGGDVRATRSCLHLIDLAGSERISKTDATGDRLKEAQAINKSLSSLGDVIAALGKKGSHVPYRNSKLTFLLQDSLSGNSKVLMFCNVSPASYNVGETMCSLNFAARCRNTELGAAKKGSESTEIRKYKQMVQKLQDQIAAADGGSGGGADGEGSVKKSGSAGNLRKKTK
jgi:kinesin family protein C2/C3